MRLYLQPTGVVEAVKFLRNAHPCVLYSEGLLPPKYHNKSTVILQQDMNMMSLKCLFMICCMFLCTQAEADLEKYRVAKGGQDFFFF